MIWAKFSIGHFNYYIGFKNKKIKFFILDDGTYIRPRIDRNLYGVGSDNINEQLEVSYVYDSVYFNFIQRDCDYRLKIYRQEDPEIDIMVLFESLLPTIDRVEQIKFDDLPLDPLRLEEYKYEPSYRIKMHDDIDKYFFDKIQGSENRFPRKGKN